MDKLPIIVVFDDSIKEKCRESIFRWAVLDDCSRRVTSASSMYIHYDQELFWRATVTIRSKSEKISSFYRFCSTVILCRSFFVHVFCLLFLRTTIMK